MHIKLMNKGVFLRGVRKILPVDRQGRLKSNSQSFERAINDFIDDCV